MVKSVREKQLHKITGQYPDVNKAWLMTGKGQMLLQEKEEKEGKISDLRYFVDKIEEQAREIGALKKEIEHLKKQLADAHLDESAGCVAAS